jgi:hypothetical protein
LSGSHRRAARADGHVEDPKNRRIEGSLLFAEDWQQHVFHDLMLAGLPYGQSGQRTKPIRKSSDLRIFDSST